MPTTSGETKPLTFEDAFAESAPETSPSGSAPDTTSTEPATVPSPADAKEPPVAAPSGEAVAPQDQGPIPFDRHSSIVNAREKERDDAIAELKRVEWAKGLIERGYNAEQVQEALSLMEGIDGNPTGFLERFHGILEQHPTYGQQVRSWAGRILAGRQAAPADDGGPEPQPDMQDAKGVPVFSAPRMLEWQKWHAAKLRAEFAEQLRPFADDRHAALEQQQTREHLERAVAAQRAVLTEFRKDPEFKDREAKVRDYMKAKGFQNVTLHEADRHILLTEIIPALKAKVRAETLAEQQQLAAAGRTPKASDAAPVGPKIGPTSFADPSLKW